MNSLYQNLVIVIDAANRDLADETITKEQYDAKMKSTVKKMDLFLKKKAITQDQYDELKGKMDI